jgi:hypothetical protein
MVRVMLAWPQNGEKHPRSSVYGHVWGKRSIQLWLLHVLTGCIGKLGGGLVASAWPNSVRMCKCWNRWLAH